MNNLVLKQQSWLQPASREDAIQLATMYSKSSIVPKHFQGKPEDCLMAMMVSEEKGISLWDVFQSGFIIHGKWGWDTKFVVANINQSSKIKGGLKFTKEAKQEIVLADKTKIPNLEYTAWAIDAETGEKMIGPTISVRTAIDQGWWEKNPLWRTDTENMLWQRAAKRWGNMYGIGIGGSDKDEVLDVGEIQTAQVIDSQPRKAAPIKTPTPTKPVIEEVQAEPVDDSAEFEALKAEHIALSGGDAAWMTAINAATTIADLEAAKDQFDL